MDKLQRLIGRARRTEECNKALRAVWSAWNSLGIPTLGVQESRNLYLVPASSHYHRLHHQGLPAHQNAYPASFPPHDGVSSYSTLTECTATNDANTHPTDILWTSTFPWNEDHKARDHRDCCKAVTTGDSLQTEQACVNSYPHCEDPTGSQSLTERENRHRKNPYPRLTHCRSPAHSLPPSLGAKRDQAGRDFNFGLLRPCYNVHIVTNRLSSITGQQSLSTFSHHRFYGTGGSQFGETGNKDDEKQAVQREPYSQPVMARDSSSSTGEQQQEQQQQQVKEQSWIDRFLPPPARPFAYLARLDKPTGTWLLAWPCFWSIALAAPPSSLPDLHLLFLFGTGAMLLRGAGCTVNDLWDRDIDAKVSRTRNRPLASGALTPLAAVSFLGAQLLLGLAVLMHLNTYSIVLGAASLPLVFSYPLAKRFTFWPQAILGLTFNWGALLGWTAVSGSIGIDLQSASPPLFLYSAGICWTLVYDTIYAHQDRVDDERVGVKSTARLFASHSRPILAGFSAATVAGLALAGHTAGLGYPFYAALSAGAAQLLWQVTTADFDDRQDCYDKFASNVTFGAIVFAGIVTGKLLPM